MAVAFKSRDHGYCIVTNFKVMYSTLTHQQDIFRLDNFRSSDLLNYPGKKYLIVRNPYYRLESFFRDKFVISPREFGCQEKRGWQVCQKLFFDEYAIDTRCSAAVQRALMTTTFEEFIRFLPSKFMLDPHLWPQLLAAYVREGREVRQIVFDEILQMEDETHIAFLERELNIDTSKRYNETASRHTGISWSTQARKIVNDLYKIDFEQLGYEILDN